MPDPIFTRHCAIRLMERGITREDIMAAVNFGQVIQSYDGKDVYALERMRVVVARSEHLVVTAWREQKENRKRKIQKCRRERQARKRNAEKNRWRWK